MMTNDLSPLTLPDYSIEYTPTKITIKNFDSLSQAVDDYASRYTNYVVSSANEKDAKDVRAELRKLSTALDEKRKEIKKDYNKPLDEFTGNIKALQARLGESISPIDAALKELEANEREARRVAVQALIVEMAPNYEVHPEDIEIDSTWTNKSTTKKKIVEGIAVEMKRVKEVRDKLATDTNTITKYAEAKRIPVDGFVDQLANGQEVDYLIQSIDNAANRKVQQQKELEAKTAEEQTHQKQQGDAVIDTDTGEVVSREVILKITATIPQMTLLKNFMDANGISYQRAGV